MTAAQKRAEARAARNAALAEAHKIYEADTAAPWKAYSAALDKACKTYDADTAEPGKASAALITKAQKTFYADTAEPRKTFAAAIARSDKALAETLTASSLALHPRKCLTTEKR